MRLLWMGAIFESESVSWPALPLDGRALGRQLLSSISRNPALVVGDLLDPAGMVQLDRGAAGICGFADSGTRRDLARRERRDVVLRVVLGRDVGDRRAAVWAGRAVPGHRAGVHDCSGLQHGLRDAGTTVVCRS